MYNSCLFCLLSFLFESPKRYAVTDSTAARMPIVMAAMA